MALVPSRKSVRRSSVMARGKKSSGCLVAAGLFKKAVGYHHFFLAILFYIIVKSNF